MNKLRTSTTGIGLTFLVAACGANAPGMMVQETGLGGAGGAIGNPTGSGGAATGNAGNTTATGSSSTGNAGAGSGNHAGMGPSASGGMAPIGDAGGGTVGNAGATSSVAGNGSDGGAAGQAAGGTSAGGAQGVAGTPGEAGGPPIIEPDLVTSGQGSYWQVGELTEGGSAEFSVDENDTHQEWLGFGGTFNEAGWDALAELEPAERDRAIRLLFDAADGAGFDWGRFPIGASDYALDRYTLNDTADDYEMDNFSIARDQEMLIPYIQAALAVNPGIRLWASPWSPPAWMKDNNNLNGLVNGAEGHMLGDTDILDAYALYFAKFVEAYAALGLTIDNIHPQNEPGYATRYPSCLWSANLLRDFVRDHLGPTFEERGITTEIWLGTMSAPEDTAHIDAIRGDSAAFAYIKGFGLQWNTMSSVGSLASTGFPVMQSEHKCGNYPWETATFNASRPPNDHAYAEESWGLIRDWIKAGVNGYSAWNMVLDTQGQNLDVERPWPQNALLTVDRAAGTLTETPAYYVFRHVSQYVDAGAVRVGTTGSIDALAFKNPDGSIVTVVYNSGGQARPTTLGVGGTTVQFDVPAHGWATVNWH